jgi:ferredoxin-NADP reductase
MWGLVVLLVWAAAITFTGTLPFTLAELIVSVGMLLAACLGSNRLLARLYRIPANSESSYITALILACIMTPPSSLKGVLALLAAGVVATASKYVLSIKGRHIFNPAAAGAVIMGILGLGSFTWWIGGYYLLPITLVLGLWIVRKIRRVHVFVAFTAVSLAILMYLGVHVDHRPYMEVLSESFTSWPLIFFGTVMLTEPLTMPSQRNERWAYAVVVAVLFASRWHVGAFNANPEIALCIGNLIFYFLNPQARLVLKLKEKKEVAPNVVEFSFMPSSKPRYIAGQYLEWTLPIETGDSRGNRRFFSIASSPTEDEIHLGAKFYTPSSKFKETLRAMEPGDIIVADQVAGDFILPKNTQQKLAFLGGGIGVTPFRSMVKYMLDTKDVRDLTMLYAVASTKEIAYKYVFDEAMQAGMHITYVSQKEGEKEAKYTGFLTEDIIRQEIPDYKERLFYVSGPNSFVDAYKATLRTMGVPRWRIKRDYFPGY